MIYNYKFALKVILRHKVLLILFAVCTLWTCIDPYTPKLTGYESLLVVESMISDGNISNSVILSRTIQDQDTSPVMVSDANVIITDNYNTTTFLQNGGKGIYKTDSLSFRGVVGRIYTLHITTREGVEYESEPCMMHSVPDIDSVYFEKDQELFNNGTESQDGIRIYLDSKAGDGQQYLRWAFAETWKFAVPNPKMFDYLGGGRVALVHDLKKYCWKTKVSDQVIIPAAFSGPDATIRRQAVFFIAPAKSDRLMLGYSILVKQYSISEGEYEFWNNLKKVNESGTDIFASQPFSVISNIRNINNPGEKVLGFFQVSAEKQKRIFIPFGVLAKMQLPFYHNEQCVRIEKSPSEYGSEFSPKVTFDELYSMFCIKSDYYFIEPMYGVESGIIEKLVFARPECANCELTGTRTKPEFWVDLN